MNDWLQDAINGHAGHLALLDRAMKLSATELVFLAAPLLLALWFWPCDEGQRALNQRIAATAALSVGVALLAGAALGRVYFDARPFVTDHSTRQLIAHPADNSFPSDHATLAFALGGALVWWRRALGAAVLAAALLVGVARVYVGVHWPSDVLAAAIVGLTAGALLSRAVPWLATPQRLLSRYLPAVLLSSPPPA